MVVVTVFWRSGGARVVVWKPMKSGNIIFWNSETMMPIGEEIEDLMQYSWS